MKPDNWNRFAAGLLAILLCLCLFSIWRDRSETDSHCNDGALDIADHLYG